jgi:biotin synthase
MSVRRIARPLGQQIRGHATALDVTAGGLRKQKQPDGAVRGDWSRVEVQRIFDAPLMETIFRAVSRPRA